MLCGLMDILLPCENLLVIMQGVWLHFSRLSRADVDRVCFEILVLACLFIYIECA